MESAPPPAAAPRTPSAGTETTHQQASAMAAPVQRGRGGRGRKRRRGKGVRDDKPASNKQSDEKRRGHSEELAYLSSTMSLAGCSGDVSLSHHEKKSSLSFTAVGGPEIPRFGHEGRSTISTFPFLGSGNVGTSGQVSADQAQWECDDNYSDTRRGHSRSFDADRVHTRTRQDGAIQQNVRRECGSLILGLGRLGSHSPSSSYDAPAGHNSNFAPDRSASILGTAASLAAGGRAAKSPRSAAQSLSTEAPLELKAVLSIAHSKSVCSPSFRSANSCMSCSSIGRLFQCDICFRSVWNSSRIVDTETCLDCHC